jgi:hypothetical protein
MVAMTRAPEPDRDPPATTLAPALPERDDAAGRLLRTMLASAGLGPSAADAEPVPVEQEA